MATAREQLATFLSDLLPEFKVRRSVVGLDVLAAYTLIIDQKSIALYPPAPLSGYLVTFELAVIAPGVASESVEDALDEVILDILSTFDSADILWTNATKGKVADRYMAYTVDLSVFSPKE